MSMTEDASNGNESDDLEEALRKDRIGYDPATGTYYAQYDTETVESLTTTIIRSIATVTGKPPHELRPLYDVIDPDALEDVFAKPRSNSSTHDGVYVTFLFESCKLTISWDGEIRINPPDDVSSPAKSDQE